VTAVCKPRSIEELRALARVRAEEAAAMRLGPRVHAVVQGQGRESEDDDDASVYLEALGLSMESAHDGRWDHCIVYEGRPFEGRKVFEYENGRVTRYVAGDWVLKLPQLEARPMARTLRLEAEARSRRLGHEVDEAADLRARFGL